MNRFLSLAAWLFLTTISFATPAADTAPDALVKTTVEDVLGAIKDNKDQRALMDIAEKKVLPHFDFKQMTQLAVGKSWSQASATQQQALEREFRTLLVRTYTAALSQSGSGNAKVEVKPAQASGPETVVRTVVTESGRKGFNVDYRMKNASGGWKVYDVVVDNLSLVTNYRDSFASEISRAGIDGLIKTLESKNKGQA